LNKTFVAFVAALLLILMGCNKEEASPKDKKEPKQEETVKQQEDSNTDTVKTIADEPTVEIFEHLPEVPKATVDFVQQGPGKFADKDVLSDEMEPVVLEELKDLPALNPEASDEEIKQYFQYAYSLIASDFADPNDLIQKWEFSLSGNPDLPNSQFQFKENYNIEIILDASGSMKATIGGKTRMELAKEAIQSFLANVPKEANVSLRVYGHKGTGSDQDKALSCSRIDQVYGFAPYEEQGFTNALNQFDPSGWTPVAASLEASKQAFQKYDAKTNTNLIYLVSDGIETCDGDPVAVAKSFADSNVAPIINVIGFDVDSETQKQLKQVAQNAKGVYTTVTSKDQLAAEFDRAKKVLERWEDWKKNSLSEADVQRVDNNFEILAFMNDWRSRVQRQYLNINSMLSLMYSSEKIDIHQKDKLWEIANELDELMKQAANEIEVDLKSLNIQKVNDLKQQINDKYESSTQP
jgi:Ca-activated chloride channel homolog